MLQRKQLFHLSLCLLVLILACPVYGQECFYIDKRGTAQIVKSLDRVPKQYKHTAKCTDTNKANYMAAPDEISHEGLVSRQNISSSLGRVELSYPREVKKLLGKDPKRAVVDIARAVSKALKSASFPTKIRLLDAEWKIVFLGENISASQVPAYLRAACHPGWMTPPTNVYIAADKISDRCGAQQLSPSQAYSDMVETLAHEMGHVVENAILGQGFGSDRPRAEGFATWFEIYVARYSSLISEPALKKKIFNAAKKFLARSGGKFDGSAGAYGYASLPFFALVDRRGVSGLMDVYEHMIQTGQPFRESYKEVTGWSDKKIQQEIERVLK